MKIYEKTMESNETGKSGPAAGIDPGNISDNFPQTSQEPATHQESLQQKWADGAALGSM